MFDEEVVFDIPNFTKDDFTNGTEPFEFLETFADNNFLQQQMVMRMKDYATSIGVKAFVRLWNAYQKSMVNPDNHNKMEAATQFDGQPLELYCGDYNCTEDGISYINKFGMPVVVCQHPILVSGRYVNVDTGEQKLEIAFSRAGKWKKPVICDRSMLASSQKIVELSSSGVAVDSENAKELVKYITFLENRNYDKLGETNSVGRLGWINDYGFSPYVDGLHFDGDISFRQMFNSVKPKGTLDEWLEVVKPGREHSQIVRIMLAASFASVLIEPLGCLPFFCHVWGGTEAGKTVGLMVASSVWANPAQGEYYKTFNTTAVHMELLAGFCNSLPLCFDELQIIKDRQDFDKTIYMLSEGVSRGRGAKSGGIQKTYSWHNCIITTGEMPISNANSGGGAVNRIVEIDCKSEKLFTNPRDTANGVRKCYGTAGKAFVDMLGADGISKATELYQEYYADLVDGDTTEKQAMAGALILTGDALADEWIFKDGLRIDRAELENFLVTKDEVDVNKRALMWLVDYLAVNSAHFNVPDDQRTEVWGELDETTNQFYIISSIFDSALRSAGFNPDSFKSWALSRNIIDGSDKNRRTKRRRIRGAKLNARCVCINFSVVENMTGLLPEDEVDELPF